MLSEGELKLSEMKSVIERDGMQAYFQAGALHCSGGVILKKQASHDYNTNTKSRDNNHVVVDGPLCDEYYRIRDLLYQQYVIL
jgi:cleavage and polyadenylation specificity factor subunit 2